ncbi:MAG: hypothetical protein PHE02_12390 [Lachnospiraceae bacterium]|nr:hypothetical protein [Lachnospiraceae bacterium]
MDDKETIVYFYCARKYEDIPLENSVWGKLCRKLGRLRSAKSDEKPDKNLNSLKNKNRKFHESKIAWIKSIWIKNGLVNVGQIYANRICQEILQERYKVSMKKRDCYGIHFVSCELPFSREMIRDEHREKGGEGILGAEEVEQIVNVIIQVMQEKDMERDKSRKTHEDRKSYKNEESYNNLESHRYEESHRNEESYRDKERYSNGESYNRERYNRENSDNAEKRRNRKVHEDVWSMEKPGENRYYVNYETGLKNRIQLIQDGVPFIFMTNYYKQHVHHGVLLVRDGFQAEAFLRKVYENLNYLLILTTHPEIWESFSQEVYEESGLIVQYESDGIRGSSIWKNAYLFDFGEDDEERGIPVRELPEGVIYMDFHPSYEKQRLIEGKRKDITYRPCPKYLDTY